MYKEMYMKLFSAVTDAIELLQATQKECEEIYIKKPEDLDVTLSENMKRRIDGE